MSFDSMNEPIRGRLVKDEPNQNESYSLELHSCESQNFHTNLFEIREVDTSFIQQ